jgi:hypothetical protein
MRHSFESLGNATVQIFEDSRPVLATDPWLCGTCYFGSWALDHSLTPQQIANVIASDYIWISHGHPDHLHHESLDLIPRGKKILLPDYYDPEIKLFLHDRGFDVIVLEYRRWFEVSSSIRVLCLDNLNQDAVLVIAAGDALIIDLNDSPIGPDFSFIRRLVRRHPNDKTYLLALCSVDADMFNVIDADGRSQVGPPEERKRGAIWNVARNADRLGVKHFCCSSSQHIYARADSVWANPHRIGWTDMQRHWSRPGVALIEPFVTVELATGAVTRNHPTQRSDESQIAGGTGGDDWNARLTAEEWQAVEGFFGKFALLKRHCDFIEITVGGESHRVALNPARRRRAERQRGVGFVVPKQSLLEVIRWGYFDDLLIGNFMKVRLTNMRLYPHFTPLVSKIGGNAKVFSHLQYAKFLFHYFRRSPRGTTAYFFESKMNYVLVPLFTRIAEALGIKSVLKRFYRSMLGDPL